MTTLIFSTGSLYTHDLAFAFEVAAEAGFDGVELMLDERYCTRDPDYVQALSAQYNLPVLVVHTPFSPRLPGWRAGQIERIEQARALAEQLGAQTQVLHLPSIIGRGTLRAGRFARHFPAMHPTAITRGWIKRTLPAVQKTTPVRIALENMPMFHAFGRAWNNTLWNTIAEWSLSHDYLTLDTTHWGTFGLDPLRAYEAAEGRVVNIHLSNYGVGIEHRLPQDGALDLAGFLRAVAASGYRGTVCTELSPRALHFDKGLAEIRARLTETVVFCREHLAV
ncbi:MAG: sugar phosphate isomerase/epimerase family protein [Anaerolineales bacterium]